MSSLTSRDRGIEKLLQELLEQRDDLEAQAEYIAELRDSVQQYEARYGMSSERIHDAIDGDELIEDRDVGHWIFQYDLLCSVEAK